MTMPDDTSKIENDVFSQLQKFVEPEVVPEDNQKTEGNESVELSWEQVESVTLTSQGVTVMKKGDGETPEPKAGDEQEPKPEATPAVTEKAEETPKDSPTPTPPSQKHLEILAKGMTAVLERLEKLEKPATEVAEPVKDKAEVKPADAKNDEKPADDQTEAKTPQESASENFMDEPTFQDIGKALAEQRIKESE